LRHWNKKAQNNLPLCMFIKPPNESQLDEYADMILKLKRNNNNLTKLVLKKKLKKFDTNWRNMIHHEDMNEMDKIKDEEDNKAAFTKIENFMKRNQDDTWILIKYWALQLEDFIRYSLRNCIGC